MSKLPPHEVGVDVMLKVVFSVVEPRPRRGYLVVEAFDMNALNVADFRSETRNVNVFQMKVRNTHGCVQQATGCRPRHNVARAGQEVGIFGAVVHIRRALDSGDKRSIRLENLETMSGLKSLFKGTRVGPYFQWLVVVTEAVSGEQIFLRCKLIRMNQLLNLCQMSVDVIISFH